MRPRHSDLDLLELARGGSAPAFASLLHRHRDVIQRGAIRSARPQKLAEATIRAAVRDLRRQRARGSDVRDWLAALVEQQVRRDPGTPAVERLLPADWFDRAWSRAERTWPSGRHRPRVPRWLGRLAGAVVLASAGSAATYLVITAETTTEVISELIAEPIEDPDVLVVPGPVVVPEPEEAPELFGDVELGELPTYDLTGESGRTPGTTPTLGPRQGTADGTPEVATDGSSAPDSAVDGAE